MLNLVLILLALGLMIEVEAILEYTNFLRTIPKILPKKLKNKVKRISRIVISNVFESLLRFLIFDSIDFSYY